MGDCDKRPSGAATRDKELRDIKGATRTGKSEKKGNGRLEGNEPKQRGKKRGKKGEKSEKKKMDENQPVPDILLVLRNHILGLLQEKPVRSNPTT